MEQPRRPSVQTVLRDESTDLPIRSYYNFSGAGVTATDDPASGETDVVIPGVSGSQTVTYSEQAAPYTVAAGDYALSITTPGTVTLPTASVGRVLRIKNVSAGTVTLDGNGAETVEGAATYDLGTNASVDLIGITGGWRLF